jgi:hypothetical protein
MHHYWGFGLLIASEIEFPELLLQEFDTADVLIRSGKVPASIEGLSSGNSAVSYCLNTNELLFRVQNVATYYATNGNSVIFETEDVVSDTRSIRLYILATVMAAILLQRKLLPMHASAIIRDNHLILITGDSGAGKSSTLAGLVKKGYAVFSDDVIVLKRGKNGVVGTASYPMMKLWNDTIVNLDNKLFEDRSFVVKPGLDKYGIFFHEHFNQNSYTIKKIFIIKKQEVNQITVNTITGAEIFRELAHQIYRPGLLQDANLRILIFTLFSTLMNTLSVYEIIRPEQCNVEDVLVVVENLIVT